MKRFTQVLCMIFSCMLVSAQADTSETWCTHTQSYTIEQGEKHTSIQLKSSYNPDKATEEESGFSCVLSLGGTKVYRWKPDKETFESWTQLGNLDPLLMLLMGELVDVTPCETCLAEDFEHPLLEDARDAARDLIPGCAQNAALMITNIDDPVRDPLYLSRIGETLEGCEVSASTTFEPEPSIKLKAEYAPFSVSLDEYRPSTNLGKILCSHTKVIEPFEFLTDLEVIDEDLEECSEMVVSRKEGINISQASASGHRLRYAIGNLTEFSLSSEDSECKISFREITKIKRKPPVVEGLHSKIPKQESLEGMFGS